MRRNLKHLAEDPIEFLVIGAFSAAVLAIIIFMPGRNLHDTWLVISSACWFMAGIAYGLSRPRRAGGTVPSSDDTPAPDTGSGPGKAAGASRITAIPHNGDVTGMKRILAAVRAVYERWRDAYDIRSAREFHHTMGHSCSFCRPV